MEICFGGSGGERVLFFCVSCVGDGLSCCDDLSLYSFVLILSVGGGCCELLLFKEWWVWGRLLVRVGGEFRDGFVGVFVLLWEDGLWGFGREICGILGEVGVGCEVCNLICLSFVLSVFVVLWWFFGVMLLK